MENELQHLNKSPLVAATEFLKISGDMDVEKLSKFLELQERWEATQARKAYTESMANFKKNAPNISKDKKVKFNTSKGTTEYNHATLFNVTETIGKVLGEHGLSASWLTSQKENLVTVTCKITHILGHFEETSLTASPDSSGSKNPIQAIGSTVTYLQRYTLLALTGLATKDQDNDAKGEINTPPNTELNPKQQAYMNKLCEELKPPDGMAVNKIGVKAVILGKRSVFPTDIKSAPKAAKWLQGSVEKHDIIFIDKNIPEWNG